MHNDSVGNSDAEFIFASLKTVRNVRKSLASHKPYVTVYVESHCSRHQIEDLFEDHHNFCATAITYAPFILMHSIYSSIYNFGRCHFQNFIAVSIVAFAVLEKRNPFTFGNHLRSAFELCRIDACKWAHKNASKFSTAQKE